MTHDTNKRVGTPNQPSSVFYFFIETVVVKSCCKLLPLMPITMSWYGNHPHAAMISMRQDGRFQHPPPPRHHMMNGSHMPMPPPTRSFQREPPPRGHPYPISFQRLEGMHPPQGHPYPMINRGPAGHPPVPGMHSSPPDRFGPPMPPQYGGGGGYGGEPPLYMRVSPAPSFGEGPPPLPPMHTRTHFVAMERPVHSPSIPHEPPRHRPSQSHNRPIRTHASPPPLRESLIQNVRQYSPPTEEVRKQEIDPTKAVTHQNGMEDAALALISMNSIIEESKASLKNKGHPTNDASREAKVFPTRLALKEDKERLNSMHCFLRAELLELFLVEKSKSPHILSENSAHSLAPGTDDSPKEETSQTPSRIGLRCVHCAQARKIYGHECEAPMAVFYPKSIAELYRLVTSWQRVHLRKCRNLPKSVRETYTDLRQNDKTRGKTHYWVTSAKKIGLADNPTKAGGIVFSPYSD